VVWCVVPVQAGVRGVHDMQRLIAFNDFPRDPLSLNDSCNAIACRQVGGSAHP
jgi:hypothetical protein